MDFPFCFLLPEITSFPYPDRQLALPEYLLPVMIDALIQKGTAQVDVLETKDTWFGVTYQEDKEVVIKAFKELTEAGVYPNGLYK